MNLTPLARPLFKSVDADTLRASADLEHTQRRVLSRLIAYGKDTMWGREHRFSSITTPADFASSMPVNGYETFRPYVMRMISGEKNLLCPGAVNRYAQSSGTSGGKSKYIPLPPRSLHKCHYAGSSAVVARYLSLYPDSRIFAGRSLILGGSYANEPSATAWSEGRRPLGIAHRLHQPCGQPVPRTLEKNSPHERLEQKATHARRGHTPRQHRHTIGRAVMVSRRAAQRTGCFGR